MLTVVDDLPSTSADVDSGSRRRHQSGRHLLAPAQASDADLQAQMQVAVGSEERARQVATKERERGEAFFERALVHAKRAADDAVAEAKEHAAAILAEGSTRARRIQAEANALHASIVQRLRTAIDEAYQSERERLVALSAETHAQLLRQLDGRSEVLPPRDDHLPGRPDEKLPPWAERATASDHSIQKGRLAAAPDADDAFWAEMRRALSDNEPLGPRDDLELCDEDAPSLSEPERSSTS